MPQNIIDIPSNSQYATLVSFIYGGFAARYTTSPVAIDIDDRVYAPLPAMTVDLGKQSGQPKDEPITITLPPVVPFDVMLLGGPHANVLVLIQEIDITDFTTARPIFKGSVVKVLSGKNGRDDVVEVTVNGLRAALDVPLGVPANNTCVWTFGDFSCTKDLSALRVTTLGVAIAGNVLTVAASANAAPYFERGYVERNGVRIMIRHQIDASNLQLVDVPPASWIGSSVIITPGCNKSLSDCKTKWSNEAQFGGLGIAIPKYHPIYETQ